MTAESTSDSAVQHPEDHQEKCRHKSKHKTNDLTKNKDQGVDIDQPQSQLAKGNSFTQPTQSIPPLQN